MVGCLSLDSYIKPQQSDILGLYMISCLSLDSYIKPQPSDWFDFAWTGCLSLDSYIKPQLSVTVKNPKMVVYLLIPTSNHNYALFQFR